MSASDLSQRDLERSEVIFSIYDFTGNGTIDGIYIGDCLRALNMNPTQALIEKLGGTKRKGEKTLKIEEFLPIVAQARKDKDFGVYEDFLECLRLYDKVEDGKMLSAELTHILRALGERLSDKECDDIIKDCMDEEDEDGFIPYEPFIKKFMTNVLNN